MAYKRIDWDREEKSLKKLVKEEEKARIKFKNRQMNEQLFEDNAEKFFFPLTNTINSGNEKYINESKEIQNELHELTNKFNNALSYYPEIDRAESIEMPRLNVSNLMASDLHHCVPTGKQEWRLWTN